MYGCKRVLVVLAFAAVSVHYIQRTYIQSSRGMRRALKKPRHFVKPLGLKDRRLGADDDLSMTLYH